MVGYAYGEVLDERRAGTGTIWLDDVNCTGYETTLTNCSHGGWGSHNCDHGKDVSVRCYSQEPVGSGILNLLDHFLGLSKLSSSMKKSTLVVNVITESLYFWLRLKYYCSICFHGWVAIYRFPESEISET